MSARRAISVLLALGSCAHGGPRPEAPSAPATPPPALTASPLSSQQKAFHLLSRFAFGPRPGEVEALAAQGDAGLAAWLASQLGPRQPERELDVKLSALPTLAMSIRELERAYPNPDQAAKELGLDVNPETRRQMEVLLTKDHLPPRIEQELVAQKLERAVESERQLEEVLVDFWFNHFNVDQSKGEDRWMVTAYERDAIRPHVLGKFRELLEATATHPAMLFYLDNWLSVRDEPDPPQGAKPKNPNRPKRGLNENYGRELLELHTLGVDGGYTQTDVREVARCFTGWTIEWGTSPPPGTQWGTSPPPAAGKAGGLLPPGSLLLSLTSEARSSATAPVGLSIVTSLDYFCGLTSPRRFFDQHSSSCSVQTGCSKP